MIGMLLLVIVVLVGVAVLVPARRPLDRLERWFVWASPLPIVVLVGLPSAWSAAHGWQPSGRSFQSATIVAALAASTAVIGAGTALAWRRSEDSGDPRVLAGIAIAAIPWLLIGVLFLFYSVLR